MTVCFKLIFFFKQNIWKHFTFKRCKKKNVWDFTHKWVDKRMIYQWNKFFNLWLRVPGIITLGRDCKRTGKKCAWVIFLWLLYDNIPRGNKKSTSSPSRDFKDFEEEWVQLGEDLAVIFDSKWVKLFKILVFFTKGN